MPAEDCVTRRIATRLGFGIVERSMPDIYESDSDDSYALAVPLSGLRANRVSVPLKEQGIEQMKNNVSRFCLWGSTARNNSLSRRENYND